MSYYSTADQQTKYPSTTKETYSNPFSASFAKPSTASGNSSSTYSNSSPSTLPANNGYSYTSPTTNGYTSPYGTTTTTNYGTSTYPSSYTSYYPSSYSSYGLGSYGTNTGTTSYGTPSYGTTSYGTPSYGTTSYGTPSYGTTSYGTPSYGTTSYGTNYGTGTSGLGSYGNYGTSTSYGLPNSYTSYTSPYTNYVSPYSQPTSGGSSYLVPTPTPTPTPSTNIYTGISTGGGNQSVPKISEKDFKEISNSAKQIFSNAFAKTATKSGFNELLEQHKASGTKYRDLDFPPELRSLTGGMTDYELQENYIQVDMKKIIWLRAEEIYGKGKYQVFQDKVEPNDIQQGALGDCYFLSTLAAIAEKPYRIRRLFESKEANEQGIYCVKICDMGIWTPVLLDDYLPCSSKSREPIFTDTNGPELWVALLEKAWAKVYGSYARIDAGLTRECLHDLTGAPTKYYITGDPKKNEEIWTEISNGEKKDFVMTCGSGDFYGGADLMSSVGLVGSHAYSLLAALTIKDKYGRDVRLAKIRNPWGQGEWKGDWSDNSASWTPELRAQLKVENRDDGIFYMTYEDMLKYFTDIQICKVHDNFIYKSLKSSCDHVHAAFFKVTVKTAGHYYITINQESTRKHAEKENYRYSKVRVVFGKKVGDNYEYVEGITKADKEVWTDGHMDAGEYIVYAKIHWNEQKTKEFSISSYGAGDVEIERIDENQCRGFIEKVYINKGKTMKTQDYSTHGVSNCYRGMELTDDGFGYIYYKNQSNKTLEEDFYFKSMQGFKLKKPYRGNNFKITVAPGEEKVVILKQLPTASGMSHSASAVSKFI